eukprot:3186848-Rhodomonas_salina.2
MAVQSTICTCWARVHILATGPHFGDSLPTAVRLFHFHLPLHERYCTEAVVKPTAPAPVLHSLIERRRGDSANHWIERTRTEGLLQITSRSFDRERTLYPVLFVSLTFSSYLPLSFSLCLPVFIFTSPSPVSLSLRF